MKGRLMKIGEDLLTMSDVAEIIGITVGSLRVAYARAKSNRANGVSKPKDMPECDYLIGRTPTWKPDTIREWTRARGEK
jgi:hypothetical protein